MRVPLIRTRQKERTEGGVSMRRLAGVVSCSREDEGRVTGLVFQREKGGGGGC